MQLELNRRRRQGQPARCMQDWDQQVWQDLKTADTVEAFLGKARAPATVATYGVQRRQFLQFCELLGVSGAQCFTSDVICRWIMGRSANDYKLSTIELGLYAIADWLPSRGVLAEADVVHALRAAARRPSAVRRQKQPILMSILRQLVPCVPAYWRQARDFAFWLLAWYGLFRGAEMVSLTWADITVRDRGLVIYVARSKTDQAGQGQYVFVSCAEDEALCPLRAIRRLAEFQPRDCPLQGPMFPVHQDAAAPVSKRTMLGRLHRALAAEGLPSQLFGLHSLRSGGATAASIGGVPERLIKIQGRWVSDVVRLYTCALPSERWQASAAMQACP